MHVTGIKGLEGIIQDKCIRLRGSKHSLSSETGDACAQHGGISILDLERASEERLFKCFNWLHVFSSYHTPAVVLVLDAAKIRLNVFRLDDRQRNETDGRYIAEAEACHRGDIPVSCILEGWVLGANYRIAYRSKSLKEVLSIAKQREARFQRKKKPLFSIYDETITIVEAQSEQTPM